MKPEKQINKVAATLSEAYLKTLCLTLGDVN